MNYCFDIDGTICTNTNGDYLNAVPYPSVIAEINRLYAAGHRIMLATARGFTTGIDWREETERQLEAWGVSRHELHMGKPGADIYIDDKALNFADWTGSGYKSVLPDQPTDQTGDAGG
jgi:hypothetical protein